MRTGNDEIGGPTVGIEENDRLHTERVVVGFASDLNFFGQGLQRLVARDAVHAGQRLGAHVRIAPVDQNENLRPLPASALVVKVRRNDDAHPRAARGDVVARRGRVRRDARDLEGVRRAQLVHQLARVVRAVLIDDGCGQIGDRLVDEPKQDQLKERDHEGDDERRAIAPNVDELLFEDRSERREKLPVHAPTDGPARKPSRVAAACSVKETNTSSREGSMSRTLALANPAR